jgi:Spy/CpxP family protein refolding chaperone
MHPAVMSWLRAKQALVSCGGYGGWPHCRPEGHPWGAHHGGEEFESGGGGGFGVRRPLRFLAHKLDLDEGQVRALARILDDLKTERAQAEVDRRRTVSGFADAVAGETFDAARAAEAGELRQRSAERLREAVVKALQQIHALLSAEQRTRLAYLMRSGALSL